MRRSRRHPGRGLTRSDRFGSGVGGSFARLLDVDLRLVDASNSRHRERCPGRSGPIGRIRHSVRNQPLQLPRHELQRGRTSDGAIRIYCDDYFGAVLERMSNSLQRASPQTAEEVTVTLSNVSGTILSTTFVVEYPLGTTLSQAGSDQPAAKLVFTQSPSATTIGSGTVFPSGEQPIVEVEDSQGVPIYNDYSPVILSLVSSASGVLTSCVGNQSAGNGLVTFSGCLVTLNTGVNSATFSLQASDSSISNAFFSSNTNFTVSASTAAPKLVFLNTPSPNASGAQMSNVSGQSYQFAVAVQQNGLTLTSWTGSLALTTSGSTGSITQLSNCSGMAAPINGVFKISGCTFIGGVSVVNGNAPIYYTMTATGTPNGQSASVNSGTSNAFGVTGPGAATQLAFSSQPIGGSSSSTPVSIASSSVPIVVEALDSWGNTATGAGGSATLTISNGTNINNVTVTEALSNCGSSHPFG